MMLQWPVVPSAVAVPILLPFVSSKLIVAPGSDVPSMVGAVEAKAESSAVVMLGIDGNPGMLIMTFTEPENSDNTPPLEACAERL
jgi:hypothetical protein